jgi:PKD repeat protein
LFTYHDDNNELDIEINQLPDEDYHLYYTKQPGDVEIHTENISYGVLSNNQHLNDTNITYTIEWTPNYVYYSAVDPEGNMIKEWNYTNTGIPEVNSSICMNLGHLPNDEPASGDSFELVLHNFTYTPYNSSSEPIQQYGDSYSDRTTWSEVDYPNKYNYLVASNLGYTINNNAVSGSQIQDQAADIRTARPTSATVSWWLSGIGDAARFADDSLGQQTYNASLGSLLAFLTIPTANKVTGEEMTGDDWISAPAYDGSCVLSSTPGEFKNATVTGTNVYVSYLKLSDPGNRNFDVYIDSVYQGTYSGQGSAVQPSTNVNYSPWLLRFTGLSDTSHNVSIVVNASTDSALCIDWVGGFTPESLHPAKVYLLNIPTYDSPEYANTTPEVIAQYNSMMEDTVAMLNSDNLGISLVDVNTGFNTSSMLGTDRLHPNLDGHIFMANRLQSAITGTQTPVANFSANETYGVSPLTVSFTDTSANEPILWDWDFGDGNTSTEQNPTHTYSEAGVYNVTLTVTNSAGTNTTVKTSLITIIEFSGVIEQYGDSYSDRTTWSEVDYPNKYNYLVASNLGYTINNNAVSGSQIQDQAADIRTARPTSATVSWWLSGIGDAARFADDSLGQQTYNASLGSLLAFLTIPTANKVTGEEMTGDDWISAPAYDGSCVLSSTPGEFKNATVTGTNVYVSYLKLSDPGNRNFDVYIDSVYQGTYSGQGSAVQPSTNVNYSPWLLRFTGLSDTSHNVSIVVNASTDSALCIDWVGGFTPESLHPAKVYLLNIPTYDSPEYANTTPEVIAQYNSMMEDTVAMLNSDNLGISLVDVNTGFNTSSMLGTDRLHPNLDGHIFMANRLQSAITGTQTPVANFSANETYGVSPLTVSFTDTSANSPTSWNWDFGDGNTSTERNPTHVYTSGVYNVTLAVTNYGGDNTTTKTNYIIVNKTLSVITWANPSNITYGTALSGTQLNAVGSVPGTMTYNPVSGTVLGAGTKTLNASFVPTDMINYSNVTASVSLTVNKAPTSITWNNPANITYGTALSGTQLNAIGSTSGSLVYEPASETILGEGTHTLNVTLNPTDSTNYTTATKSVTINVTQLSPVANFTGTPTSGNTPLTVQFTDSSTNSPVSWNWNFGDSATATTQNPSHTYNSEGLYTVTLTVTNVVGSNTSSRADYISATDVSSHTPVARFESNVTNGTIPLTVQFNDTSLRNPTSWQWSFGDGTANSTTQNPVHTYSAIGKYNVTLRATNAFGYSTSR